MKEGIHGKCVVCDNPVYEHMKENINIWNETSMCGACATGESAVYIDEL